MARESRHFSIQQSIKRLLDIFIVLVGLLITWPFFILIALAVKLDSPGSVFFSHRRIGKDGNPFDLYKFRTMVEGGDDSSYMQYLHQLIESERQETGKAYPYRKMQSDPRVTRVGGFLRTFYLDELPQAWNILRGDMSLVGPRPHVQFEVDHYTQEQRRRLCTRPGATGLWQVTGKADCTFSELIALDLKYIDNWSLWTDVKIIFQTLVLMFNGGEGFWARMAKQIPGRRSNLAGHKGKEPFQPTVHQSHTPEVEAPAGINHPAALPPNLDLPRKPVPGKQI